MPLSLHRYERYVFFALILIHLIPVCSTHFFITLDGPVHLYNSNLINWMLSEPEGLAGNYFYFNPQPPPNILGHVILCVFNSFLPSYLAEKGLLIIYIIALPLSFRLLIARFGSLSFSYFIFPFIYSDFFYEGFFNFCLSLPLFFFLLSSFVKHMGRLNWKRVIALFILLTLLYFCHLLVFLLAFGCMGLLAVLTAGVRWLQANARQERKELFLCFFKQVLLLLLVSIPGLTLMTFYLQANWQQEGTQTLPVTELLRLVSLMKPVFTLSYTNLLFWMLLLLVGTALFKKWENRKQEIFSENDSWLMICVFMFVLLFILPDKLASGGFISTRLLLFIFLCSFIWLSAQAIPRYIVYIAICISTGVSFIILRYYCMEMMNKDKIATACFEASASIEENSVVLPLNYANELVLNNVLTYIGSEKKIVVWDNYEALTTHFPLKWKEAYLPDDRYGDYLKSNRPWVNINLMENSMGLHIDYVVRICYKEEMDDPSTLYVNKKLAEGYVLVQKNEWVEVYKKVHAPPHAISSF